MWETIMSHKEAFIEPKSKLELKTVLLQFRQKVRESRGIGAILFAVCRAKVSEGIDFSDNESRGVIVVGIPYAPTTNPRIELKKQFLTKQRIGIAKEELKKNISADEWYQVDAIRGVNQSIGRVLRHKDDFGVVVLVDSRKISSAMEMAPGFVCHKKQHEILEQKANSEGLPFDIDTLYSSEAVAAFEKSISVEETVLKRPKRKCIFEELEEAKKMNELIDINHSTDIDDSNIQSGTGLIVQKTRTKLRLRPNVSLLLKDECHPENGKCEKKMKEYKSLSILQSDADVMAAWQKSAVKYNKLLQSIEKSKCITLKMALTNYAADNNFQTLISTFTAETVPNHLEIFKGLYGYLHENHRPKFVNICRQLKLL
ncbi:unnamed protein product [Acanthocheilonema viteae]|uniref:ATP-dependent helicase C-terminal domain-containing protein n=1 Tax=Acanthocheilonema viteae TaxID=6277 RepID=A0A498SFB8_ACAVI|nr:unnamed protein product [Acanthocheilonema viteae]